MMTPGLIFLVQALAIVVLPVAVLRFSGLKGLVPLVVVQIAVGIALGPSLLGRVAPQLYQLFANPLSLTALSGIASVAVLVFGLITGLHLDPAILRNDGRAFSAIAAANVVVPTALGWLAGYWIISRFPEELTPGISPTEFAAAVGVCTGMTALPVLGAILAEMDLLGRRIAHLALGIAGVNDTVLWLLIGILLTAVASRGSAEFGTFVHLVFIPCYLVVMVKVAPPLLDRTVRLRMRGGAVTERSLAVVGAFTIASALVTEIMGLHYIIGAFVAGAVMPAPLRAPILERIQVMAVALLLPFFFTLTGLRTLIDTGSTAFSATFLVTTGVAVVGIVGGTAGAARLVGQSWPTALALGALLQTKGLMELIVLTVLLDQRIISSNVFAALVLMALVTTALAMPLARVMLAQEARRQWPASGAVTARQAERPSH
jgi:Kef-type K+ transport system membrane component KefB